MKYKYALLDYDNCGKIIEDTEYRIKITPEIKRAKQKTNVLYCRFWHYLILNWTDSLHHKIISHLEKLGVNQK